MLLIKALSASIWMVSSTGTLANSEVTSHDTRISPLLIFRRQTHRCQLLCTGCWPTAVISPPTISPTHSCTFVWEMRWGHVAKCFLWVLGSQPGACEAHGNSYRFG